MRKRSNCDSNSCHAAGRATHARGKGGRGGDAGLIWFRTIREQLTVKQSFNQSDADPSYFWDRHAEGERPMIPTERSVNGSVVCTRVCVCGASLCRLSWRFALRASAKGAQGNSGVGLLAPHLAPTSDLHKVM